MVKVRLHTILKEESGIDSIDIEANNLNELFSNLPKNIQHILNKFKDYLIILVNGRPVSLELNYVLNQEDIVDITLPVGGG